MLMRRLEGSGQIAYDSEHDMLLFKVLDREYSSSLDFEDVVIDVDTQGFAFGIRIFDASAFFDLDPSQLKEIRHLDFEARAEDGEVRVRLKFECAGKSMAFDVSREAKMASSCVVASA